MPVVETWVAPGVMIHPMSATAQPRIGVIGLGQMGMPICGRLAECGFPVFATDLRPELRDRLALEVEWASDAPAVAREADVLITVLPMIGEYRVDRNSHRDGAPGRSRTHGRRVRSSLLYPLSYGGARRVYLRWFVRNAGHRAI